MKFEINSYISISHTEFDWHFVRSSGSGGQNVNKVNSKAVLKWKIADSPSLKVDVKQRFLEQYANRINQDGFLVVQSDRFRDQPRNAQDCLEKLRDMLLKVAEPPKPRKPTKPTRSSRKKRLDGKKLHSQKKLQRQKNW